MYTNSGQRGVIAQRRLSSDFHTPVPHTLQPRKGAQRITRATWVAFLPSVKLYTPAGKVPAALSPDKNPFDLGSLALVGRKSNSRFFTDCYHEAAAFEPPDGRKWGTTAQVQRPLGPAPGPPAGRVTATALLSRILKFTLLFNVLHIFMRGRRRPVPAVTAETSPS